ncbi:MAG: ferritin-like domain-containing protein [Anaerolineae bacterium]|nr:ferritin-like domain-containing protein [Anaerolineae bacterium]
MKLNSLEDLFIHELKDLYSAEKQLTEALPKMVEAANTPALQDAFNAHLKETETHLERVHQILQKLNVNPGNAKCDAMEGLIEEGEEIINMKADADVKDAALIGAAQRVEHYEMAGYGTARTFALRLGHIDAADLLQQTLDEEGEANKKLTSLAENGINEKAQA